jgi:hypothetical protein
MLERSAGSSMDRASDYGSEGWGFDSLPARYYLIESDDRPAHRFRKLPVREDRRKPQTSTEPEVGRRHENYHAIRC